MIEIEMIESVRQGRMFLKRQKSILSHQSQKMCYMKVWQLLDCTIKWHCVPEEYIIVPL